MTAKKRHHRKGRAGREETHDHRQALDKIGLHAHHSNTHAGLINRQGCVGLTAAPRIVSPRPSLARSWSACAPPPAALTAVCCAQLGTVLPILPLRDRLLTSRVVPDERTNRPTTTAQPCGRSRQRAGTPRVREGGPPCRRRCQSRLLRDHPPLFTSYATAAVPSASAVPFPS